MISGRFVYTMKEKPCGAEGEMTESHIDLVRKLDARLCARGFLETATENVSAPTISIHTVRAILAIVPTLGWKIRIVDVSRAFLQSENLERELYLDPPKGAELEANVKWKVLKPIYGLCDATKYWHNAFKTF